MGVGADTTNHLATTPYNGKETPHDADTNVQSAEVIQQEVESGVAGINAIIIVAISLACFLVLLDAAIIATAVPRITTEFHSLTQIGWYGAAYQLGSTVLNPLTGKIYANFNLKWTFLAFIAIFEVGSVVCGAASTSDILIVGRTIAGVGAAGLQTGTFTIIVACARPERRSTVTGAVMGISQFGLVVGPLVGGALTQYSTWRWCFYLNLPCGAVVAGLLLLAGTIPELSPKSNPLAVLRDLHNRMDLLGVALFAPACIMLLLAVQWGGNTYAWSSSIVIGMIVGAGMTFLVWLAWDWYRQDSALIPLSMVARRNVWSGCLTFGLIMSAAFCQAFYLPLYFQSVKGVGPTLSGVYMLPSIVTQLIAGVLAGRLVQKLGYYLPFIWFSCMSMSAAYGLISTFTPMTSTGKWIGYQILLGFGRGTGMQMPFVSIQHNLPLALIPMANALMIFAQTFGSTLTLSFADTILTNTLRDKLKDALPTSTVATIIASGGVGFRNQVDPPQLMRVLWTYTAGIDRIFYMLAAFAATSFITSCWMGWKDIRSKSSPSVPV